MLSDGAVSDRAPASLQETRPAMSQASGRLVILSGPSGVGKSTVLRKVLERSPVPLRLSISATTRSPRPGEVDGQHYYFLPREEFARRRANGEFLECCEVFGRGDWYGTLASEVAPSLKAGEWVVLEIDVEGAASVLSQYPDAITIFVEPGDEQELERRLRGRGTETEEALARRLEVARRELAHAGRYRHRVTNASVENAVNEIIGILKQYQHEG